MISSALYHEATLCRNIHDSLVFVTWTEIREFQYSFWIKSRVIGTWCLLVRVWYLGSWDDTQGPGLSFARSWDCGADRNLSEQSKIIYGRNEKVSPELEARLPVSNIF
jgi:hypothetical protein